MKLGVIELPEFEITGIAYNSYLVASALPNDGSVMLAVLVSKSGVVELNGRDRIIIAKVGSAPVNYDAGYVNWVGHDPNLQASAPQGWALVAG